MHIDGGMTEYLSGPLARTREKQRVWVMTSLPWWNHLAIGAHGVGRADVKKDEYVLVMGAGPIGFRTMQFAQIAGARVIAVDINEKRLQFCKDLLKVGYLIK